MPAVELARLRKQSVQLVNSISQPDLFMRNLSHLLEQYSDHTFKPGLMSAPGLRIPSYRVSPFVLRQLENEMKRIAEENPLETLKAAEAVFQDIHLESRILASVLAGAAPITNPSEVLELLEKWFSHSLDRKLHSAVIRNAITRFRKENPDYLLEKLKIWLKTDSVNLQNSTLEALKSLIAEPDFQNLPIIFNLLESHIRKPSAALSPALLSTMEVLVLHEPKETAMFLNQVLQPKADETQSRFLRRLLPTFPPAQQNSLRLLAGLRPLVDRT